MSPLRYLLDTNTVSYIATGRSHAARTQFDHAARQSVLVSAVSKGEIPFGIAKRPAAVRAHKALEDFRARVEILAWDRSAALAYGTLRANLTNTDLTLSALDLPIAAHAVALGAVLVTHDRALHRLASYLPVEDWATDV